MKSVKRIALAVPLGWEYTYALTEGILRYQSERGGFLLRDFRFDDPTFAMPPHPPTWEGWDPCGVLCAVGNESGLAEWLLSAKLPVVNMTADVPAGLMPSVHATGGGKLAVEHLASLGLKHIAYVGLKKSRGSDLRCTKVAEEAQRLGLKLLRYDTWIDPVGSLDARVREAAAEPGLVKFLRDAPKPLGVAALNDDFARCVCLGCQTLELRIPEDVAIVGVDDSSAARLCDPPLTSIRPPGRRIGYAAMKLLDGILRGLAPPTEPEVFVCDEIEVRQSTRPARDDSMQRALQLIESEAGRGLAVGDLVRHLAISRSNLEKRFYEEFGTTPGNKIRLVKLDRARELLSQTELSITRIAAMLGYSRNSAFTSFFRSCDGETPSEFRQRTKGAARRRRKK